MDAQSYTQYVKKADSLYNVHQYERSMKVYLQALEIKSTVPHDLYNAACSAALAGADRVAITLLKLSVESGWTNIRHLKADKDLASLHPLPEWTALIDDLQKKVDGIESNYDKALQQELLTIYDADQRVRQAYMNLNPDGPHDKAKADSLSHVIHKLDSANLIKVTKILDTRGWVGKDVVGGQASDALFLVIQHSDLPTRKKYLPLLKDAVARRVARPDNLALMEDRIAIGEGRMQLYGSQLQRNDKTGKYFVLPIEDVQNVDARRAAVGLPPMSDYVKTWGLTWDPRAQEKVK